MTPIQSYSSLLHVEPCKHIKTHNKQQFMHDCQNSSHSEQGNLIVPNKQSNRTIRATHSLESCQLQHKITQSKHNKPHMNNKPNLIFSLLTCILLRTTSAGN